MAYDRGYTYVTWGGALGSGSQEIWQNGVKMAPGNPGSTAAMPTGPQSVSLMQTLQAQWILTANLIGSSAILKWLKFSKCTANGNLMGEPIIVPTSPVSGVPGPASTNSHPFQVSVVATLWSGQTFGKANYGRIYLPDPRVVIQADGQMGGTLVNWVNWVGTWLKALETSGANWADGQAPMFVSIMNNGSALTPGVTNRVTAVRMGSVMDTQRRRRNKLRETYTTATTYP